MKNKLFIGLALLIGMFGLLTLFMSSAVIFDLFGIRAHEGNYVLFIVWANFICGFLYLITTYGLLKTKSWAILLLLLALGILILSFIAFLFYISSGGIYETKTLKALIFRITLTIVFVFAATYVINKKSALTN